MSRIDRWILPEGKHDGLEKTPGYYDRIGGWFTKIAAMLNAAGPQPEPARAPGIDK